MKKAVYIILLTLSISQVWAYPITPRPLRQLIKESQYIITGQVVSVTELPSTPQQYRAQALAKIQIEQTLKGHLEQTFIEVPFDTHMICPQPAYYEPNTWVMAFLDFEQGVFNTHALSYGSKTLQPDELKVYQERVLEMQKILTLQDPFEQYKQTLDWLITCAEHPATQWEGVFELSPDSDFMSFYASQKQSSLGQFLSVAHKERLMNILKNKAVLAYGDLGIVDLVYPGNEAYIDQKLIESLSQLDEFGLLFTADYMLRLQHLVAPKLFEKYIENAQKYVFEEENPKKQKKNIAAFIASIKK